MSARRAAALTVSAMVALAVAGCRIGEGGSGSGSGGKLAGTIRGAGATLPLPLYGRWAAAIERRKGIRLRYQPLASGGGIGQFTAGLVDFGATDVHLNEAEVVAAIEHGAPVHVPVALAAVAVAYRLPGAGGGLRLDPAALTGIFLGRIRRWNDPVIARLNPGRRLYPTPITVVHRSDNSGSTQLFTTYMARVSPEWARRVGADKAVRWPPGVGAATSAGAARAIASREGAIGYTGGADAAAAGLAVADVRNRAGRYTRPGPASIAAAARGVQPPDDLRLTLIDASSNAAAYPLASPTFMLVYRDLCEAGVDRREARRLVAWLRFVLGDGQRLAGGPGFAPLPAGLLRRARDRVSGLFCNGERVRPSGS